MVILSVDSQVIGEVTDFFRQQRYLHFRRAGILFSPAVLGNQFALFFSLTRSARTDN